MRSLCSQSRSSSNINFLSKSANVHFRSCSMNSFIWNRLLEFTQDVNILFLFAWSRNCDTFSCSLRKFIANPSQSDVVSKPGCDDVFKSECHDFSKFSPFPSWRKWEDIMRLKIATHNLSEKAVRGWDALYANRSTMLNCVKGQIPLSIWTKIYWTKITLFHAIRANISMALLSLTNFTHSDSGSPYQVIIPFS